MTTMNILSLLDSNNYDEHSDFWTVMTTMNILCLLDSNDYDKHPLSSGL
jgi:hypothetical protein